MTSLQKQTLGPGSDSPEILVISFEKKLLNLKDVRKVEILMKKLQYLGTHFNPFAEKVESECEQILTQLGLIEHMRNPYLATNILLRLLDKTEERLNNLKQ
jgi:hypothetical protein